METLEKIMEYKGKKRINCLKAGKTVAPWTKIEIGY